MLCLAGVRRRALPIAALRNDEAPTPGIMPTRTSLVLLTKAQLVAQLAEWVTNP